MVTSEGQSSNSPLKSPALRNSSPRAAHWCVLIACTGLEMSLWELQSSFVALLSETTQNRLLGLQLFEGSHQSPLIISFFWDK